MEWIDEFIFLLLLCSLVTFCDSHWNSECQLNSKGKWIIYRKVPTNAMSENFNAATTPITSKNGNYVLELCKGDNYECESVFHVNDSLTCELYQNEIRCKVVIIPPNSQCLMRLTLTKVNGQRYSSSPAIFPTTNCNCNWSTMGPVSPYLKQLKIFYLYYRPSNLYDRTGYDSRIKHIVSFQSHDTAPMIRRPSTDVSCNLLESNQAKKCSVTLDLEPCKNYTVCIKSTYRECGNIHIVCFNVTLDTDKLSQQIAPSLLSCQRSDGVIVLSWQEDKFDNNKIFHYSLNSESNSSQDVTNGTVVYIPYDGDELVQASVKACQNCYCSKVFDAACIGNPKRVDQSKNPYKLIMMCSPILILIAIIICLVHRYGNRYLNLFTLNNRENDNSPVEYTDIFDSNPPVTPGPIYQHIYDKNGITYGDEENFTTINVPQI